MELPRSTSLRLCCALSGALAMLPACDGSGSTTCIECEGVCVDLQTDSAHCGDCAVACAPGSRCEQGACNATCPTGLIACSEACIDPLTDRTYCGASADCLGDHAGTPCDQGQLCVAGGCSYSCPGAQIVCDEACIDPLTDRTYCGAGADCLGDHAGTPCDQGQLCVAGGCSYSCPGTQIVCGEACIDPLTDRTYCGASADCLGDHAGTPCDQGQLCVAGGCSYSCPGAQNRLRGGVHRPPHRPDLLRRQRRLPRGPRGHALRRGPAVRRGRVQLLLPRRADRLQRGVYRPPHRPDLLRSQRRLPRGPRRHALRRRRGVRGRQLQAELPGRPRQLRRQVRRRPP